MLTKRAGSQTMFLAVWGIMWRLAAIAFACYAAWRVRFIVIIVVLSAILTFMINPLVDHACRWRPKRIPRTSWRFAVTLTTFLILIAFTVGLLLRLYSPFEAQLDELQRSIGSYKHAFAARLAVVNSWYKQLPPQVQTALTGKPVAGLMDTSLKVLQHILTSTFAWVSHIWELLLIPVLAFYFCLDSHSLKRELMVLIPYRRVRETLFILDRARHIMQSYVLSQLLLCIVAGVTVGVGLWLLHVPYPLVLGVLAGVTRAVPIVGPVVSAIPITLLAVTVSLNTGLSVLTFFCCLHLVESKVLLPQLIGHSMKLHPAIILIVLLIGGEFFGILGMFLAAPLTAIARMLVNIYLVEPEILRRKRRLASGSDAAEELLVEDTGAVYRKVS